MKWALYLFESEPAVMQQMLGDSINLDYCPKEPSGRRVWPRVVEALNSMVPKYGSMHVPFEASDFKSGQ
jgi:hypothetical protein